MDQFAATLSPRGVRPDQHGWKRIAALAPEISPTHDGWYNLLDWILGCVTVYMVLLGIGKLVLGATVEGMVFLIAAVISGYAIYWDFSRRRWNIFSGKQPALRMVSASESTLSLHGISDGD